ncbi:S-layer protein [Methanothermococcus sp. SCGC AD-155-E23]|nr:S-layer protein [Methanothermococcus sp. SCGC AD-155-E23]
MLKNLSVTDVDSIGKYSWYLSDGNLFITGFNISKSGEFSVANISLYTTYPTYSAILYKAILSDIDGYTFQKVILENDVPIAKNIKSEKIRNFVSRAKIIVGSEIDATLSAENLNSFILANTPLEINEDCILIGGPVANPTVKKYLGHFPMGVTNEYPGKNRGVIQVTKINGHTVVLLAGSDRWGTKAAVEYFKTLDDLPQIPIFVKWENKRTGK